MAMNFEINLRSREQETFDQAFSFFRLMREAVLLLARIACSRNAHAGEAIKSMKDAGYPMSSLRHLTTLVLGLAVGSAALAQQISKEDLIFLTREWKGERFDDGRPKVPDAILDRMKLVTLEEAWAVLRNENFNYQYEGDW